MSLANYIKQMRLRKTAPSNTAQLAKQMEAISPTPGVQSKKKTVNQPIKETMEQAQHPNPYNKLGETMSSPSPTEANPLLREHIKNYKKHASKVDAGSLNKRSYV